MKISYFIKEEKTATPTIRQQDKLTRNLEKTSKHKSRETVQEKNTPQISTDTKRINSKNYLILGQLNVNRSQPSLEPLNFTVQITSKINDNSSQVSDFHFQIGTLMSKNHANDQKLLVLFRAPSPQKPPVTNYQQSTT